MEKNIYLLKGEQGILKIEFFKSNIIHICYSISKRPPKKESLIVIAKPQEELITKQTEYPNWIKISTERLIIKIKKDLSKVIFCDSNNNTILEECKKPREITPTVVLGSKTFHIKQSFTISPDEGLFGLGQFQDRVLNHHGMKRILVQANTIAVNPFLVSSKGYGILWDNYSKTIFESSDNKMSFWSECSEFIDYYFVSGKNPDEVISGYRFLTGNAPLFGKWAYGYWQSRERYKTRDELLSIAEEFRNREIPIDSLVQDWRYWGSFENWNSMIWNKEIFPNPKEMINILHDRFNMHLMISIWPCFGMKTEIYKKMKRKGFILNNEDHWSGGMIYDAYSEDARNLYWQFMKEGLFSTGVDGWWMDATEPEFANCDTQEITETGIKKCKKCSAGNIAKYLNIYSLMTTSGVYSNQRKIDSNKRVFILTRSVFAGQQRYSAATWSGDIGASWRVFRNQIAAGINFCLAGVPYWTTDIGAFFTDGFEGHFPKGINDPAYCELYVRWFQFGAFSPIFRSHGTQSPREIWQFGDPGNWAYDALIKFDKLRYRLLPYIYSTAWKITSEGYTMMRGLVMDFPDDKNVYSLDDHFMFGPSILAVPVTKPSLYEYDDIGILVSPDSYYLDKSTNGIKGEYYLGSDFKKLAKTRTDYRINFNWSEIPTIDEGVFEYSVRWRGKIKSRKKGEYQFNLRSDGGVRLWIGKDLLIDSWKEEKYSVYKCKINLDENTLYDFKLEYFQTEDNKLLNLYWRYPGLDRVTTEDNKTDIYLPVNTEWYDFWTGNKLTGGERLSLDVNIDSMPLFIKAGSIIPLGPQLQYSNEKPADPIELRIYTGADSSFNLYEDENDNYNYEKRIYSIIPIKWEEKTKTLIIGDRIGEYPGMLKERVFNIIFVKENHGTGIEDTPHPDLSVMYYGKAIIVAV